MVGLGDSAEKLRSQLTESILAILLMWTWTYASQFVKYFHSIVSGTLILDDLISKSFCKLVAKKYTCFTFSISCFVIQPVEL
jgi:hypothetical protein